MKRCDGTRGILNPLDGFARFSLERYAPSTDLAPFVERYWVVRWALDEAERFEQQILPNPCVNLAFEPGRSAVHGIGTRRFVAQLEGRGRVVGIKFRPGCFLAFASRPMDTLVDRVVPLAEAFDLDVPELERQVLGAEDDRASIPVVESFLRSQKDSRVDPAFELVARLVELTQHDRSIARAAQLAHHASISVRSLHRLFEKYMGLGPKWVIRRSRVQDAAERVATGAKLDWACLARELGYHDQAHLIHDFKEQVGFTPAVYAARCAQAARVELELRERVEVMG
jgi:AraC-like DNA-binding protein